MPKKPFASPRPHRPKKYKPLLFTTTLRNPERLKLFLSVLKNYNGSILTDALAKKIAGELIQNRLYKPIKLTAKIKQKIKKSPRLTHAEITKILLDNPQNHKEAGFNRGWPSRFDTWFKTAKEMGFVFYKSHEKIKFSNIGLKLADPHCGAHFEQTAFTNALAKYQRNNPFRAVRNENAPLILLLQVITKLNADKTLNNCGISRLELPLLIYWKDPHAHKLYSRIKQLRKEHGLSPSSEIIIDICRQEIMKGKFIQRNPRSIMKDYPDEFIRKMRLTGLISLRGQGRFIDINKNETLKIKYILKTYSKYKKYHTEESYFKYVSKLDHNLTMLAPKKTTESKKELFLKKWVEYYPWETIKLEILKIMKGVLTEDEILKYLSNPVRLEFLSALAVKSQFSYIKVIPNYPIDDEGLPTAPAGGTGNKGDIECFEQTTGILIEVTLLQGAAQTKMEVYPIARHLETFKQKTQNAVCYFVAPSIFIDSIRKIKFLKHDEKLLIYPKTIKEFVEHLEKNRRLYALR